MSCKTTNRILRAEWSTNSPAMNQCKAWAVKSALIVPLTLAVVTLVTSLFYRAKEYAAGSWFANRFLAYNSTIRAGLPRKLGLSYPRYWLTSQCLVGYFRGATRVLRHLALSGPACQPVALLSTWP